jgi:hypothetical protein
MLRFKGIKSSDFFVDGCFKDKGLVLMTVGTDYLEFFVRLKNFQSYNRRLSHNNAPLIIPGKSADKINMKSHGCA